MVFPGFSWSNLVKLRARQGESLPNGTPNFIPRQNGKFMWAQAYELSKLGLSSMYTAMFDEVDEGTAIFKTAATRNETPREFFSLTLDFEGQALPSDFYLQVSKKISESLKNQYFSPSLDLSTNPQGESIQVAGNSGMNSGQTLQVSAGRLVFQTDGNVVIYGPANQVLWATNTAGRNCQQSCLAVFQGDGNLVLYDGTTPYWTSNTGGHSGAVLWLHATPPYLKIEFGGQTLWESQ